MAASVLNIEVTEEAIKQKLWIGKPAVVKELLEKWVPTLLKRIQNHHVLALGQSPAWVVTAAKMQDERMSYQHVAMSGGFMSAKHQYNAFKTNYFTHSSSRRLTAEQIEGFRNYLTSIGVTPKSIVERYKDEGRKTVVFDCVGSGAGLASFLYILASWAKEQEISIKESLTFVAAVPWGDDPLKTNIMLGQLLSGWEFELDGINLFISSPTLEALSSSIDEGPFSDRLVSSYPSRDWEKFPAEIDYSRPSIQIIYSLLDQEIKKRLNQIEGNSPENPKNDDKNIFLEQSKKTVNIFFQSTFEEAKDKLNIHRNEYGMFSPANIARNLAAGVPLDSTASYRAYLMDAKSRGFIPK